LGFDGKSVINPRQIRLVHAIFAPTAAEVEKARRILEAYQEALARKSGVIALDGKMIDAPVVTRAERTLAYAAAAGREGDNHG
jgi:citrate lyase subunit beta/citryl-CoA lyase